MLALHSIPLHRTLEVVFIERRHMSKTKSHGSMAVIATLPLATLVLDIILIFLIFFCSSQNELGISSPGSASFSWPNTL
jgi:hypothetical protein